MDFNFNLDFGLGSETKTTELSVNEIYESFIIGGGPATIAVLIPSFNTFYLYL
jgi:alkyl hydroperoxide reductase subunit AhpF